MTRSIRVPKRHNTNSPIPKTELSHFNGRHSLRHFFLCNFENQSDVGKCENYEWKVEWQVEGAKVLIFAENFRFYHSEDSPRKFRDVKAFPKKARTMRWETPLVQQMIDLHMCECHCDFFACVRVLRNWEKFIGKKCEKFTFSGVFEATRRVFNPINDSTRTYTQKWSQIARLFHWFHCSRDLYFFLAVWKKLYIKFPQPEFRERIKNYFLSYFIFLL